MPDGSQAQEKLDMSAPSGDQLRVISDEKGGAIPAKGGGAFAGSPLYAIINHV